MALSVGTVDALTVLEEGTLPISGRGADGYLFVARELTTFLVALTEDVARLERRVQELEENS